MNIPTRQILQLLSLTCLALILVHTFSTESSVTIYRKFNLNSEGNIPTWYSTILLFLTSVTSFCIYQLKSLIQENNTKNSFWLIFTFAFLFLSLDEAAQIHELIDQHTSIKWVYIYVPFGAIFFSFCCIYFYLTWTKNKIIGIWILGGLIIYATGGLFSEWVSHYFRPLPPFIQKLEFIIEEGLEMFGVIVILTGCLKKLNIQLQETAHK